jgi:DNA-directed RNA polymerase subunit K/omega
MIEESDVPESKWETATVAEDETAESQNAGGRKRMPPVLSRFMFVDIAALRAKQLRRGALARVTLPGFSVESDNPESVPRIERIAMKEVEDGLVVYDYPGWDSDEELTSAGKSQ